MNLNEAVPGDKLISNLGMVFTYVQKLPDDHFYDHEVMYPDNTLGTRTNSGHVMKNEKRRLDTDHNIVRILDDGDPMKIRAIHVQTGLSGPDRIVIETSLPESIYPFMTTGAKLSMEVANGGGLEYAIKHFSKYKIMLLDHSCELSEFGWELMNEGGV